MRTNRFYHVSNLNYSLMEKYVNEFRVNSDKRTTLKWIRSIMAGYYLYIAYYGLFKLDFASISHPSWRNLQHHWWKCITVWNVGLQVRYFLLSFVIDHEENLPNREIVHKLVKFGKHVQDYCFITLDVPSSVFVCSLFWLIQTSNRSLLFPNEMSTWIPVWYNHAVHTYPFFVIFFQMYFYFHRNPPVKPAIFGLWLHCAVYSLCILHTKWTTGQWIYIFIGELVDNTPSALVLFFITGFVFPLLILLVGYKLNDAIWKNKIK